MIPIIGTMIGGNREARKQYSPALIGLVTTLYRPVLSLSDLKLTIDFWSVPVELPNAPNSPMVISRPEFVTSSFTSAN